MFKINIHKTISLALTIIIMFSPTVVSGTPIEVWSEDFLSIDNSAQQQEVVSDDDLNGSISLEETIDENLHNFSQKIENVSMHETDTTQTDACFCSHDRFLAPITAPMEGSIPIETADDLIAINDNLLSSYHLVKCIDLAGIEWIPIGTYDESFFGNLDGQGHVIKNLSIKDTHSGIFYYSGFNVSYGLFGIIQAGSIRNLALEDVDIDLNIDVLDKQRDIYVSPIGLNYTNERSTIQNSYTTGRIGVNINSASEKDVRVFAFGLGSFSNVEDCYSMTDVNVDITLASTAPSNMAGYGQIAAYGIYGTHVNRCFNAGKIYASVSTSGNDAGNVSSATGLFAGHGTDIYNAGNVTAYAMASDINPGWGNTYIAHAYAYATGVSFSNRRAYNSGTITSHASSNATNQDATTAWSIGVRMSGSRYAATLVDTLMSNDTKMPFMDGNGHETTDYCYEIDMSTASDISFWEDNLGFDFEAVWKMPKAGGFPIFIRQLDGEVDDGSLKILRVISPANAQLSNQPYPGNIAGTITATVPTSLASQLIEIELSIEDVCWTLHWINDNLDYEKLLDKRLPLRPGENRAFIELSAPGFETLVYLVIINSEDIVEDVTIRYNTDYNDGIANVRWGVSLFNKDSFHYNKDLAQVAAALAAASGDEDGVVGLGRYLVPAYRVLGFDPEAISLFSYPDNALNESSLDWARDKHFAFSIAHKKMDDGDISFDLVTVILRGTETNTEGWGDAFTHVNIDDFHGYKAYRFFNWYAQDVMKGLDFYINKNLDNFTTGNVKFLIGGHSLGGAAANLFAVDLVRRQRLGVTAEDVYAFTFGALNSITTDNYNSSYSSYGYIWNYFNALDTYGPLGAGFLGVKPTKGALTIYNKFGNMMPFMRNYIDIFEVGDPRYANHVMASYYDAIERGFATLPTPEMARYYRSILSCPVDVEVYDNLGKLVGRVRDNVVDEEVTAIPMTVFGENNDNKLFLIPADGNTYSIKLIGTDSGEMSFFTEPFGEMLGESENIKMFDDVALTLGKTMTSAVGGGIETADMRLFVLGNNGQPIKEVQTDGTEIPIQYTITTTAGAGGSVTGGGNYNAGDTVTLIATPNSGYTFDGWYESGVKIVDAGATYSFEATANRTLEARFTASSNGNGGESPSRPSGSTRGSSSVSLPNDAVVPEILITDGETPLAIPTPLDNPFEDVKNDDWFFDSVIFAYTRKLMLGTSTEPMMFSPNMPLTRGMIVTILWRLQGSPEVEGTHSNFADVAQGSWYETAVSWAAMNGLVHGYGDGLFGPDDNITRQDLAVILMRYADLADMTLPVTRDYLNFNDEADISNYAKDAIERFFKTGIINGKPSNIFDPKGGATRAEVATMLHGLLSVTENGS